MEELLPFCECGCGQRVVRKGNKFIQHHQRRGKHHSQETKDKISQVKTKPKPEPQLCECGCGELALPGNGYIWGHNSRGKKYTLEQNVANSERQRGIPKSEGHRLAISKATKGVPKSFRTTIHNITISKSLKNSEAAKAQSDKMRGGNDICEHHYIYDHSDLSKYTMKMTRSKHTYIHNLMRKAGIVVPHINMEVNL